MENNIGQHPTGSSAVYCDLIVAMRSLTRSVDTLRRTALIRHFSATMMMLCGWLLSGFCWSAQSLVMLNWHHNLDPLLVQRFEADNAVKVRQVYFNSDEERTERLLETEGRGYDLVLVSGIDLQAYVKRGWLRPLALKQLSNGRHIDPYWHARFAAAEQYAVPFAWGTLGVVYRSDLLSEPLISWQQLYKPSKQLSGRIGMIATPRHLVGMGLKALGYSANTENPEQLSAARSLIKEQAPHVRTYSYPSLNENSEILTGNIYATMISNGDALKLRQYNDKLEFSLPMEGGNLWVNYLAIPVHARHPELALKFIDFLNDPENAARQARYSNNPATNRAAITRLPASYLNDPRIYPKGANFASSEFYEQSSPATLRHRNETVAQIRQ